MKNLILLFILAFPISVFAQSFSIKGYGKSFKDGDKIFLTYNQGDDLIQDSTIVKSGFFELKGIVKDITRGYLSRNDNPRYAYELFDSFDVYIEPGNILLHSTDTLNHSILSGTPLNNDYAILVAALKPITEKRNKLKDPDKLSIEELKDSALVKSIKQKQYDGYMETFAPQFNFISHHPKSYVSLITLSRLARTSVIMPQVEASFSKLSNNLKITPEGKEINRRLQMSKMITVGMMAKNFIQNDRHGNPVSLKDFAGKYILLDFWASWCLPCREENPNLIEAYQKYKSRNFKIISISIDTQKDKDKWLKAIEEDKLPWLQLSDLKKQNEAAKVYGITTIPANVLIDPSGKVIAKDIKGKELHRFLASIFD